MFLSPLRTTLITCVLLLSVTIGHTQRLCEALVDNAMEQALQNCVGKDGELSCYAYNSLSATHFDQSQQGTFIAPGNIADLATMHTIQSATIDLEEDEWGIAYLQTRANLPSATADESVRLFMLGDVFMENAVEGDPTISAEVVIIATTEDAVLRDSPSETGTSIATPGVVALEADALSDDVMWLRTSFEAQTVWVKRDDLFPNDAIDGLPLVSASTTTASSSATSAFGNLYFSTGGDSDCQEAPNMLVIQTPSNQSTDLTINDIPARFGSTVALGFNNVNGEDVMWITVIEGEVTLYPDTPQAVVIEENHTTEAIISPSTGAGAQVVLDKVTGAPIISASGIPYVRRIPTENFSPPIPVTEQGASYKNPTYYDTVYKLPESLLNYAVGDVPPETDNQPTTSTDDGVASRVDNDDGTVTISETICVIRPVVGSGAINARIGPGTGRSVRTIIEEGTEIEGATAVTAADGSLWYEFNDNTSSLVYVSGEDVEYTCENVTRIERIDCQLNARSDVDQLWGYVGPGYNRNVSTFLDLTLTYEPIGRVDLDDVPWFEVVVSETLTLWVDGTMFNNLEGCDIDELQATPPPIVVTVAGSNATRIPIDQNTSATQAFVPVATQQSFSPTVMPTATPSPELEQEFFPGQESDCAECG